MTTEALIELFETSEIVAIIGLIFVINLGLTLAEVALDLTTRKERRWKNTTFNCAIFAVTQVLEALDTGPAGLGEPVGPRTTRLAYRMLGHDRAALW